MIYFIRPFSALGDEHFQLPRTRDTVRRSLDGMLCIVAFDPGTEPDGWADGMDADTMRILLESEDQVDIWWSDALI